MEAQAFQIGRLDAGGAEPVPPLIHFNPAGRPRPAEPIDLILEGDRPPALEVEGVTVVHHVGVGAGGRSANGAHADRVVGGNGRVTVNVRKGELAAVGSRL